MALYRAYLLTKGNVITGFQLMECLDDDTALRVAATIKSNDCLEMEVWETVRFVGRTKPDDAAERLWWRCEDHAVDPEFLVQALGALDLCYCIFDRDERLVAYTPPFAALHDELTLTPGRTWNELARQALDARSIPEAIGQEQPWLWKRRQARGSYSTVRRRDDGRCYQVDERRTADGGLIIAWTRLLTADPIFS